MLEQFLGRRRPRVSRAVAAMDITTEHPPSHPDNRPTDLHHRASPPRQQHGRSTIPTGRRAPRRVSLTELFASTQRQTTISETVAYRSASDQTRAILEQLQSARVLIMDQTCYVDFGNEHDCLPILPDSFCPICLEEWQYGERVLACPRPCQHVYHVPCLAQWLDASSSTKRCPCCRLTLDPTPEQHSSSTSTEEEITRLRLPAFRDPFDSVGNTSQGRNEVIADMALWSAMNADELDVDTVLDTMSEMAVADGGRGTTLTFFRLPPGESVQTANHVRDGGDPPSLTSVGAVVTTLDTTNIVDLDDISEPMEDPQQPSHRQGLPPASDLKERLRPWLNCERGVPPNACLRAGHHHVYDSVSRYNCALCDGLYDATSRYTLSQDVNCPHLYHEECWLDYACRYLLERDDNSATEDGNHAAVGGTTSIVPMDSGGEVHCIPCVCCRRPYLCVPEDVVVVPHRRQRRLPSF